MYIYTYDVVKNCESYLDSLRFVVYPTVMTANGILLGGQKPN